MSTCTTELPNSNTKCMEPEEIKTRKFGGIIMTGKQACANKKLANIEKKHLRAYLRGEKLFNHGLDYVKEHWV